MRLVFVSGTPNLAEFHSAKPGFLKISTAVMAANLKVFREKKMPLILFQP